MSDSNSIDGEINWELSFYNLMAEHKSLQAQADKLADALTEIEDIASAIELGRKSSYGDWELRNIARKALKEYKGENK